MKKYPIDDPDHIEDGELGQESDSDRQDNSVVRWYQWQETKNDQNSNVLAKILHEGVSLLICMRTLL